MARAPGETAYFLEHDGRVFLVRDGAGWRLPRRAEVPFSFREKRRVRLHDADVVMGAPESHDDHPDWPWKDELPFRGDVEGLARSAANLSMARVVAKAVFLRGEGTGREMLLVKPLVGFYRGRWSLPGGYLDYGEHPEECVLRELEEELGVRGRVLRLLRVDSQVVPSGVQFITFLFEGRLASDRFRLKADEIAEARWFPLADALAEVASEHSRKGIEDLLREERAA
jgi:ADP-ribose pyrophosphatase YjhB (NUDIX family)